MKSYFTILLAFCLSGCYSQLQYTESLNGSNKPSEDPPFKSTEIYTDDLENWYFYGIDYFPYYKDYSQAEWFSMPEFNRSTSFYHSLNSGWSGYDSGLPVSSYFSNPILVCWNPPVYPASGYAPSNIPINIGIGIINDSRIKKSGGSNHGPRTIGPNRVRGSQVLPDRTRSKSITRGQRSITGRSSGSSARNRTRNN